MIRCKLTVTDTITEKTVTDVKCIQLNCDQEGTRAFNFYRVRLGTAQEKKNVAIPKGKGGLKRGK